jgi:hypothetical protein
MTSVKIAFPPRVSSASAAAAGLETILADVSRWAGSFVLPSPLTTPSRGEWRPSLVQPRSPPASSLRTLLLHKRSGVEVSVSPYATTEGGCVSRSTEMGDLQRKHPIIELIRTATAKSGEKYGGGKLTRLLW